MVLASSIRDPGTELPSKYTLSASQTMVRMGCTRTVTVLTSGASNVGPPAHCAITLNSSVKGVFTGNCHFSFAQFCNCSEVKLRLNIPSSSYCMMAVDDPKLLPMTSSLVV